MNVLKYLLIFIFIILYTSPKYSRLINSKNYNRVVAAHLNYIEPLIIV
jgi:hypothetical protein